MIVVVGSGIAGLVAALSAAQADPGAALTLLVKGRVEQSNTWLAQGGIAAVVPGSAAAGDTVQAPWYGLSRSTTSNWMLSVRQLSLVPNNTSTQILPIGAHETPGTMP